jgi:hypothetical protein
MAWEQQIKPLLLMYRSFLLYGNDFRLYFLWETALSLLINKAYIMKDLTHTNMRVLYAKNSKYLF